MPLQIIRQDITKVECDAIVNTTNLEMIGNSGVDYAIYTAAGPRLAEECQKIYPLGLGCAKITEAYNLPAKYVIHTSAPIWQGGDRGESDILKSCYIESLKLATKYHCESVAFPLICSGAYGYPKDQVLKFAVEVISQFLYENEIMVYLCVYDKTSYKFSKELYKDIKAYMKGYIYFEAGNYERDILAEVSELEREIEKMDKPFIETLLDYINKKGLTEVDCYKKANVDRKTFSKLKNNPKQKPKIQIAVAFAIALKLTLEETQQLLSTAGLTLSTSIKFDLIVRFFIEHGCDNIYLINEALYEFDQVLLGTNYRDD